MRVAVSRSLSGMTLRFDNQCVLLLKSLKGLKETIVIDWRDNV